MQYIAEITLVLDMYVDAGNELEAEKYTQEVINSISTRTPHCSEVDVLDKETSISTVAR